MKNMLKLAELKLAYSKLLKKFKARTRYVVTQLNLVKLVVKQNDTIIKTKL